jgi:tetratricopeptide (TPR) repeat protein
LDIFDSAIIEFNLGNFKKALALFDQVLQLEPFHVTALIKKGNILGKFAKYSDAIQCYDKALSVEPKNSLDLINKGLALLGKISRGNRMLRYDTAGQAKQCADPIQQGIKPSSKQPDAGRPRSSKKCNQSGFFLQVQGAL